MIVGTVDLASHVAHHNFGSPRCTISRAMRWSRLNNAAEPATRRVSLLAESPTAGLRRASTTLTPSHGLHASYSVRLPGSSFKVGSSCSRA